MHYCFSWVIIKTYLMRKVIIIMMTILYEIGEKLYINLTNKCPCNCTFCIRKNGDGAYGSDPLWLDHDPDTQEVIDALKKKKLDDYKEIIYCGYGEPTEALDVLVETAKYIKSVTKTPVRINTNGLSDLIHKEKTAQKLKGIIDIVSVSLNAGTKQEYLSVTVPCFGEKSYQAMLDFASDCKNYVSVVKFTIVDVIPQKEIDKCKEISEKLQIPLRIRKYDA